MLEFLNQIDTDIFLFFNGLHTTFFDNLMWFISGKFIWIPLYLLLVFFLVRKYRINSLWWLLALALVVLFADRISSGLIKPLAQRWRPTHNPAIEHLVHVVNNYRGGSYGFVSSHAANTFAVATLLTFAFQQKWAKFALIAWATVVSYSRIYLGVHYPGDVICGAALGIAIALAVFYSLRKLLITFQQKNIKQTHKSV